MDDPIDTIKTVADRYTKAAEHLTKIAKELEEAVDYVADHPKDARLSEVATAYFMLKEAHEALDKSVKKGHHPKDRMNKSIIPQRMEAEGTDQLRVPEISRSFGVRQQVSASFIDKEKGFEWLRELGQGDIITETVNAGTLASFVRNMMLEEGIDPPDDVVKVNTYSVTGINKYTPKDKI